MNELHRWIYEYAPAWSSETWAYVALVLSIAAVLYRFFAVRRNWRWASKVELGLDFAEAEARNLRNRAKAKEHI